MWLSGCMIMHSDGHNSDISKLGTRRAIRVNCVKRPLTPIHTLGIPEASHFKWTTQNSKKANNISINMRISNVGRLCIEY